MDDVIAVLKELERQMNFPITANDGWIGSTFVIIDLELKGCPLIKYMKSRKGSL